MQLSGDRTHQTLQLLAHDFARNSHSIEGPFPNRLENKVIFKSKRCQKHSLECHFG